MRTVAALLVLAGLPAAAAAEPDAAAGREVFLEFCAVCHGTEARGDGPMVELLTVMPPDLTRLAAENGGVFPMIRVVRQIDGRDPLLAHGGEMPLFGARFGLPDSSLTAETGQPIVTAGPIADVATYLMSIQE